MEEKEEKAVPFNHVLEVQDAVIPINLIVGHIEEGLGLTTDKEEKEDGKAR